MLAARPFAESQLRRLNEDPWGPVRRIVAGVHYEAIGELAGSGATLPVGHRRQPLAGFSYGGFLQPSEGLLYAALVALATGNAQKADTIFSQALEHLPRLPANHEAWIPLTAFAAVAGANGVMAFEALIERHGHQNKSFLATLPLPARNNLLIYCLRNQQLERALGLVEDAGPDWQREKVGLEEWAFRLSALSILHRAGHHEEFIRRGEAYQELLRTAGVDPAGERFAVEVALALRLAEAARDRGDLNAALRSYRSALTSVEKGGATAITRSALGSLLLSLGRLHERLHNIMEAKKSYQRCIAVLAVEGTQTQLSTALSALARIYSREGNQGEAVILHTRKILLSREISDSCEHPQRTFEYLLCRALLGSEEREYGWKILYNLIESERRRGADGRALLISCLLTRLLLSSREELDDETFWASVRELVDFMDLSAADFAELAKAVVHAVANGRQLPDGLVDVAKAAHRFQHVELGDIALALLTEAGNTLQSGGTSSIAVSLVEYAREIAGAITPGSETYRKFRRQLRDVKSAVLQHDLTQKPEEMLVAHWQLYFADVGLFSIDDWVAASHTVERVFENRPAIAGGAKGLVELVLDSLQVTILSADRSDQDRLVLLADIANRFSALTLRYLQRDGRSSAAALARLALDVLDACDVRADRAGDLAKRLSETLLQAEPRPKTSLTTGISPNGEADRYEKSVEPPAAHHRWAKIFGVLRPPDRKLPGTG